MDTAALKNFAQAARRQLLAQVSARLEYVLTADSAELREKAVAISELKAQIKNSSKEAVIDKVAYTWFNRFCALRFMDVNGFTVISTVSPAEGHTLPLILAEAKQGQIDEALLPFLNKTRVMDLLTGKVTSRDPQGEAYRHLLVAVCNYYNAAMPFLFEKIQDYTELLMPEDLLSDNSVLASARKALSVDACENVEVIGWLYQFYISEKKDEVMARKSAVPTEDIPAVTQLFTPHWIVRYLVENSLGRLWLLNRPNSKLCEQMPYYIAESAEASGEGGRAQETDFLKISNPEEIRLLDPACGSGHMLTYAFDLLYRIYEEEGYASNEIPALILQHNLYGLEICPRAAQLAQFALVCKAREKSRSAFRSPIQPQVMCLEDVVFTDGELASYLKHCDLNELLTGKLVEQAHQFRNTATFGALLQPLLTVDEIVSIRARLVKIDVSQDLFLQESHLKVVRALDQAEMLSQRYHVVVANPPFMGSKGMNARLKPFLQTEYTDVKSDLFSAFMVRLIKMSLPYAFIGMMTPFNWMFLSSFEKLRSKLLNEATIISLVKPSYTSFFQSAIVSICAFIIHRNYNLSYKGDFYDLGYLGNAADQPKLLLEALSDPSSNRHFRASAEDLKKVPGSPIAYWATTQQRANFEKNTPLMEVADVVCGMTTGDNNIFVRQWPEVSFNKFGHSSAWTTEQDRLKYKWFPYNKGGSFRKWYGNNDEIVNWEMNGRDIISSGRASPRAKDKYFSHSVTWSFISSSYFGVRYSDSKAIFDMAGCSAFSNTLDIRIVTALLCSNTSHNFLKLLNPTLNFQVGNVGTLPVPQLSPQVVSTLTEIAVSAIDVARTDWDNFESSWNFSTLPLLRPELKAAILEASWQNWEAQSTAAIHRMQELETENNRLFINAYGLADELKPEVPEEQITLARADARKDMAAFLSYAVGCMMGRYSLDKPGLILANAGDSIENYLKKVARKLDQLTFLPDADGIIPILDGEWFEDDIVAGVRRFLRATFGDATLEANLKFIEESLGKDLRTYFLKDFYKDHIQTYKKRPIYWLFSSPKGSFNALIYLHRYQPDTVSVVLNDYLRAFRTKLSAQKEHQEAITASATVAAATKTRAIKDIEKIKKILVEIDDYERETLYPLAAKKLAIDLDDGVKVNYCKFGKALRKIPGLDDEE